MANKQKILTHPLFAAAILAVNSAFAVDLTFFAVSDVHVGQHSAAKDTARARMPAQLNALPGTAYPNNAGGGTVATPRGVVLPGDLVEFPQDSLWNQYIADYGVNGESKVHFPVYDGLGNHDQPGVSSVIMAHYLARNAARQYTVNFDSAGYNYSWDWDGVHFVHLNLYSGGSEKGYFSSTGTDGTGGDPLKSRNFLQLDLALRVGASGRPVFIMQHYPMTDNTFWTAADKTLLANSLQGYNVVGILNGHSHAKTFYKWNGYDAYDDGTVMNGDVIVFHITDNRFLAVNRIGTAWGTLISDKTISMGTPTRLRPDQQGAKHQGLFTISGMDWTQNIPEGARSVEISDLRGHVIRRLSVQDHKVIWDRLSAAGRRVSEGVYLFKITGKERPVFWKVVLNP